MYDAEDNEEIYATLMNNKYIAMVFDKPVV